MKTAKSTLMTTFKKNLEHTYQQHTYQGVVHTYKKWDKSGTYIHTRVEHAYQDIVSDHQQPMTELSQATQVAAEPTNQRGNLTNLQATCIKTPSPGETAK